jgi:hypothetical protein
MLKEHNNIGLGIFAGAVSINKKSLQEKEESVNA